MVLLAFIEENTVYRNGEVGAVHSEDEMDENEQSGLTMYLPDTGSSSTENWKSRIGPGHVAAQ